MQTGLIAAALTVGAAALVTIAAAAPATAAGHGHRAHARKHVARKKGTQGSSSTRETPLTGATLTSAENAAIAANPGATAKGASTETDSSISGAAYEVQIVESNGTRAVVIEDSSFKVLATQTKAKRAHRRRGHRGGNGETALTGATLTSAENAAIAANPGATAKGASTETDSSISGAAYEVRIVEANGTPAVVIEDSSFKVLATQTQSGRNCHGASGSSAGTGSGSGYGDPLAGSDRRGSR